MGIKSIKSIKSIKMSSAMIFGEWRECMVCMANNKRSCENGRTANRCIRVG